MSRRRWSNKQPIHYAGDGIAGMCVHQEKDVSETLGFHYVKSTYGMWLPGDERGSWSERWEAQIGFTEPHMLHAGDPVRLRMAQERMKHPPVVLDSEICVSVERTIGRCSLASPWKANGLVLAALIDFPDVDVHLLEDNSASSLMKAMLIGR